MIQNETDSLTFVQKLINANKIKVFCYIMPTLVLQFIITEHPGILNVKKKFLKMLFTLLIVFIVCWSPFQIFVLYRENIMIRNYTEISDNTVSLQ